VLATLAPLGMAALIWFVTGSAFALIFAVLSPVIAVASMFDMRRSQRKRATRDAASYAAALDELRESVAERLDDRRQALRQQTPSVACILAEPAGTGRWRRSGATLVSLGRGTIDSELRLAAGAGSGAGSGAGAVAAGDERQLRRWAATLTDAPIHVDAGGGIGIIGPPTLARAMARGIVVQLCFAIPPTECWIAPVPSQDWAWAASLPHSRDPGRAGARYSILLAAPPGFVPPGPVRSSAGALLLSVAERVDELPPGCATVVRVHGPRRAVLVASPSPSHAVGLEFHPELVSAEAAIRFASGATQQARAAGLGHRGEPLPTTIALADIGRCRTAEVGAGAPASLACILGRGDDGDFSVDLVRGGPHAVVGGTTGSGKSELLVTWVTALAGSYSPAEVTFLLVDFKGGAAFEPLQALPHCVGLITDLGATAAARALASLAAELRYREGVLAAAHATDVTDSRLTRGPGRLPRLVIVVDEFGTMINAFPELHALFVDIAARGRSLGMHLILCTQRPAGVVRDALLANCSLRLSLRVNNAADSQAVIGTDAAAALPIDLPGRCLIAVSAAEPGLCQVATTRPQDIRALAGVAAPSARRPWLDPLPSTLTDVACSGVDDTDDPSDGDGLLLGLFDEPERQRYRVARWDPARDGHLLIVGGPRSGKSSLLHTLAAHRGGTRIDLVPADVEGTWDALDEACRDIQGTGDCPARVLLVDDFDSVCARWETEHRLAALDMIATLLRDGAARGLTVVMVLQRLAGALNGLTALCPNLMLLRLPNAAEHVAAGGQSAQFDASLPPGGGRFRGLRVQLLAPRPGTTPSLLAARTAPLTDESLLVVSSSPARTAALWVRAGADVRDLTGAPTLPVSDRLELSGGTRPQVLIGDPDAWQTQWALLAALRVRTAIVFDGCSLGEFRVIGRRRSVPPALAPGRGHVWVLRSDGTVERGALPVGTPPSAPAVR